MNIFILDENPIQAAKWLCDKHVIKMALETAQLLCGAHYKKQTIYSAPYHATHLQHPCSVWVRKSIDNYRWLVHHGLTISKEYTERYKKKHKSQSVIEWCRDNEPTLPKIGLTEFAIAVKGQIVGNTPVEIYRNYYRTDKKRFATWKQNKPYWF